MNPAPGIDTSLILPMVFHTLGGLGIFLLGMKNMSEGMQAISGPRLRGMINAATTNPVAGVGVGTAATCLVQSSSITTVMTVGLVNVGLMTLTQAIGVILGANIGTTITGWILVLPLGKYGLEIIGIAAMFYLFSRNDRLRFFAMFALGLGLIFFGLDLMKAGFKPLRGDPAFIELFARFRPDDYLGVMKCVAVGAILTAVVQSSSATLGITMGLAETGLIGFDTAAALVLGENIGTTITAFLASLGTSTNARRAALAHVFINVLGVAWITAIFPFYLALVTRVVGAERLNVTQTVDGVEIYANVRTAIALTHSGFNIVNVLVFLPLIPMMAALLKRLVPDKPIKEISHLTYLDMRMLSAPSIGIVESKNELLRMGSDVLKMMGWLREELMDKNNSEERRRKHFHREEVLDMVQKEITEFLSELLSDNVGHDMVEEGRKQIRMADEFESISDYINNIFKMNLKLRNENLSISEPGMEEILKIHDRAVEYLTMIVEALRHDRREVITKARSQGDQITHMVKNSRDSHLRRVGTEQAHPLESLIFTDMINAYRRIKDHAFNIAEALAGEK